MAIDELKYETEPTADVIPIRPAPKRGPGRPRKIEPAPQELDLAHHAARMVERQKAIEQDELVRAVENRVGTQEMLRVVCGALAAESASLLWSRTEAERKGKDTAMISSRRVDCLRKLSEVEVRLRSLNSESFNLASEPFQALFGLWVSTMQAAATQVLPMEQTDLFLSRFSKLAESWEDDGQRAMEAAMENLRSD